MLRTRAKKLLICKINEFSPPLGDFGKFFSDQKFQKSPSLQNGSLDHFSGR